MTTRALFASSRGGAPTVSFGAAVLQGLAPDGGLYVPLSWPHLAPPDFDGVSELPAIAGRLLAPFMEGDPLARELAPLAAEALDFPAPLVPLAPDGRLSVLELFHGPTAAFKDFGARFLAGCFGCLRQGAERPLTILVATSGDTGGAVAAAFHQRPGVEVAVLFPKGLVSPTQERQLTCWGGNVRSVSVRGTFDDCQRLVKEAFRDAALATRTQLSSANSINLGRLLPQMVYYAAASLATWRAHRERASFIVPSGNLGNALACLWARRIGLPIGEVVLAHNANRTVPDFLASGEWRPRPSVATLASAMDVGDPSNMERLRALHAGIEELRAAVSAVSVSDDEIRARIVAGYRQFGQIWCPHTATAAEAWARLPPEARRERRWVLAATAHPAKFREIVEPLIGRTVPVPETLAKLFARPAQCVEIDADGRALRALLEQGK
ncbi:MAG: threonine synthase [Gammaproteobacteria bacterium 13_2_20CM_66_19]|nr:MAG: threonine synthase [Gammaproteobacteria bacterium 13_2_20CM_66_19]TLZ13272.1 MAG: threonine synthase [Gammaproteobacteria bacterium]